MRIQLLLIIIFLFQSIVFAETWNLPSDINDTNTKVNFEVDSTWHFIEGDTKKVSGKIWLEDPRDYSSVRASINLPVAEFNTDGESRDERMREVMHAESYPEVSYSISKLNGLCDPKGLKEGLSCDFITEGSLMISGVTKPVSFPSKVTREQNAYTISGSTTIQWADFNIEDPSILVAKLDPDAKIKFSITIPDAQTSKEEGNAKHN